MKKILIPLLLLFSASLFAQDVPHAVCAGCWDSDSLGNRRVVVSYTGDANAVLAQIPWRRRDLRPQDKRIIVVDAASGEKIPNVKVAHVTPEKGEIFFEPRPSGEKYYIYYMPYRNAGSANYPQSVYLKPENTSSEGWARTVNPTKAEMANVEEIQAIDSFDLFGPMEVIATQAEADRLLSSHRGEGFVVFPENRLNSIRMFEKLPRKWLGVNTGEFRDTVRRGENFAFQLGVYALTDLHDLQVIFDDLQNSKGDVISKSQMVCVNTTGTTYDARPLRNHVNVPKDSIQPMWCVIEVSEQIKAGTYQGKVTVVSKERPEGKKVNIRLAVTNEMVADKGVGEPWKMTRLPWLNSTLAQENSVLEPYTPILVENNTLSILGRKVKIYADGLPENIQTFFTERMTEVGETPNNILNRRIEFITESDGKKVNFETTAPKFFVKTPGTVMWEATSQSPELTMDVEGTLEFDGFVKYTVKITAKRDLNIDDIRMEIPFSHHSSKYMMGMGQKGGFAPDSLGWKWDVAHKNQDGAWVGNVNAGLQFSLRDEHYVRPLNTNFYLQKPLLLPTSWGNGGKGGINMTDTDGGLMVNNYSGARVMKKGDELFYNFTLLITPFHSLNTDFQWENRFYHAYNDIQDIKKTGATIINIHHATPINPWINYPFIEWQKMKNYIDSAHDAGLKVKIYNTVRELSNHAYETFALRSLGHEIYSPGKGGGFSWLQEHLGTDYIAAWFVPKIKDAAIINSGMNRWHNYYVEGMNWLTQNVGIDGIYLDDVAFDRITMKRIKRVLTRDGHPGIIDLHSANQYNERDGYNNSANLYMEHFPYLNRLWFGEYFDYEKGTPDFYLTEVSGIPFGLMGEMLEGGGNPYRGMIYGMTNRMPWSNNADPRPLWKLWDDFGMKGTQMIGYWVSDNLVKVMDADKVLATVYQKEGKSLVSIASWEPRDTDIRLQIDWNALGIDPAKAKISAPEVENFQEARSFGLSESIPVQPGKGWLLILSE